MARMQRLRLSALLVSLLWLTGCFSGTYVSRYDKFTGVTTKDGRIGMISTTLHTYAIHAHAVAKRKQIHIYVLNSSPTTLERLDMLADENRVNLPCLYVKDGQQGHHVYRLFACDLDPKHIAVLTQARSLKLRVNGVVGTATPEHIANITRVLQ